MVYGFSVFSLPNIYASLLYPYAYSFSLLINTPQDAFTRSENQLDKQVMRFYIKALLNLKYSILSLPF